MHANSATGAQQWQTVLAGYPRRCGLWPSVLVTGMRSSIGTRVRYAELVPKTLPRCRIHAPHTSGEQSQQHRGPSTTHTTLGSARGRQGPRHTVRDDAMLGWSDINRAS